MDFLKLVQKKDHKTDNKIIVATVVLVILIMSLLVFWPNDEKQKLISYLPDDVSFYYHFTSKKVFADQVFNKNIAQERIVELENILEGNFLNLQEIIWFQTDANPANDNYLLKFSRLPKSFLMGMTNKNLDFRAYSPEKNILLINRGKVIDYLEARPEQIEYFDTGVSIYWHKGQAPSFLSDLIDIVEPAFVGNRVLVNWQTLAKGKNKLSLLEERTSEIKNIKEFLMPKEFDFVFAFNSQLADNLSEEIIDSLLKSLFDSLPYYNLDKQVIKDRVLQDAIVWQKDDGWILASDKSWQDNILDFINTLSLEEVSRVLSDGTAYTELVAAEQQNVIEHQINGQKILQIDDLFIWDIGDKHYLSNKQALIAELTSYNYYLGDFLQDCLGNIDAKIGDLVYLRNSKLVDGQIKDYLSSENIEELKMLSYATGTISGLNICF
ncbi:MAG: hypothetical protein WC664_00325 [Patescibacteria group bacterium]